MATGWSDPVAGWELHPLETNTFSRRTLGLTPRAHWTSALATAVASFPVASRALVRKASTFSAAGGVAFEEVARLGDEGRAGRQGREIGGVGVSMHGMLT